MIMWLVVIGTILTMGIVVLQVLLCCGFPLGEYAMGGKYKVFPRSMRIANIFSILLLLFFNSVLLQLGNIVSLELLSHDTCRITGYCIGGYLLLNTIMNACSRSRKEARMMTPISLVTSICFLVSSYIY